MGYVNPSSEPEPRGFADQFEWDGHGWLFRRYYRDRPVRVTADEMGQCIDYYDRWTGRVGKAVVTLIVGGVAALFFLEVLVDFKWANGRLQGFAAATVACLGWVANRWIWQRATERFINRVPVGVSQSWIEDRQLQADQRDWIGLLAPVLFFGIGAYLVWPLDQARWFEVVMAAFIWAAALFDLALKLRARFL